MRNRTSDLRSDALLSLFFTELKIYRLSFSIMTNMTLSTLLIPAAVCRTRVIWTSKYNSLTVESLWLSGRASQRGIGRSELRFLMGTHSLVTRRKTIFSIILNSYKCGNLRLLNVLSCGQCGKKGNPTQQQRDLELLFLLDYGGKSEKVNMFLNNAN